MKMTGTLEWYPLSRIRQVDGELKTLIAGHDLAPIYREVEREITHEALRTLLQLLPVRVYQRKADDRFICVSGWRQLMLAQRKITDPSQKIPVLVQPSRGGSPLVRKLFLAEAIQLPAFLAMVRQGAGLPKNLIAASKGFEETEKANKLAQDWAASRMEMGLETDSDIADWSDIARESLYRV